LPNTCRVVRLPRTSRGVPSPTKDFHLARIAEKWARAVSGGGFVLRKGRYTFKLAETAEEFEQVHRLNYRTFVHEIPQHADNGEGRLVDKYHDRNIYFLALVGDRLVGMISLHDQPPFSIESRLADSSVIRQPGMRPLEVRLLAIEPGERHTMVLAGLVYAMNAFAQAHGFTHYLISGVTDQVELYKHIGFKALGPAVREAGAAFVPMMTTLDWVETHMKRPKSLFERRVAREGTSGRQMISLLPGPVPLAPEVRAAIAEQPVYHRSAEFVELFEHVRTSLCRLTNARSVAMTVASGTLANDAIAATLAVDKNADAGLVLVNGEFGSRILGQAHRFGLKPSVLRWDWGKAWDLDQVADALSELPEDGWVWGVHQESSTGVMNDLAGLVRIARARGVRVCCDCVSSIGAVPLDLSGVYLASGATGKALSSFAGLALIFADPDRLKHLNTDRIPSYLDLPATLDSVGPRFTVSSSFLKPLAVAMRVYSTPEKIQARFDHYTALGRFVRERLRRMGLPPLAPESVASPVITSFYPPGSESATEFVNRCETWGYQIGGQSGYLHEQRVVQIANMGAISRDDLEGLFEPLENWLSHQTVSYRIG
jgi:aspartate aminotransferase-like enzyme